MKQKVKSLIENFTSNLNSKEKKIPVQDLSIFFSVLIATLTLHKKQNKNSEIIVSFADYNSEFKTEIHIVEQRFDELVKIFTATRSLLRSELQLDTFENLKYVFSELDDDLDDIISWSYQYLKKDLEKSAFKKIGKDKAKIKDTDLLFTTQFFTDKYMVKYLVNESLSGFDKNNIEKVIVIDCAALPVLSQYRAL